MGPIDSPTSRSQRRLPRWLVVLMSLGVVLVLGGALLVVSNPPTLTFGWFACAPLSEETYAPLGENPWSSLFPPAAIAGWVSLLVGLLLWAFCAGWLVGRRRRPAD
ncbi:hypothetical protein KocCE7_01390 [Kocuria marina subsp. indica]|nr:MULTISPECIES: hypothetical protein [Kocuria]MDT0119630.1 hypothetical protein [Kocuria sp. PD6]QBJ20660.1 hypothetical protein KocCE7_01390 [Kocuria indica]